MKSLLLFLFLPPERSDFIQPHGWKPQDILTQTAESSPTAAAPSQIPLAQLPVPSVRAYPSAWRIVAAATPPPPQNCGPDKVAVCAVCTHTHSTQQNPVALSNPVSLISTAILFLEPLNLKELPNIESPVTEIWT